MTRSGRSPAKIRKWEYEQKCDSLQSNFQGRATFTNVDNSNMDDCGNLLKMKRNTEKKQQNSQVKVQWQKQLIKALVDLNMQEILRI